MDNEYHKELRKPSTLVLLFFKKKLTVTGINGKTQGVKTAINPVIKQMRKICQILLPATPPVSFSIESSITFEWTGTEKEISPLGNWSPDLPNQLKVPFITTLSLAFKCNGNKNVTLSSYILYVETELMASGTNKRLPI